MKVHDMVVTHKYRLLSLQLMNFNLVLPLNRLLQGTAYYLATGSKSSRYLPRVGVARKARSSDRSCPYVCLSVCLFLKRVSGNSYTVENASNAALVPRSPEMEPPLAAVGSAIVAVISQSSGVAAIFGHEAGSRGLQQLRSLHVVVQTTVPWLLLL